MATQDDALPLVERVTSGELMDMFATAPFGPHGTLLLARRDSSHEEMSAFLIRARVLVRLGPLPIPFDNATPLAVVENDSTILVITGSVGTLNGRPAPATIVTRLSLTCRDAVIR